jgi:hypothetical protein
MHHLFVYAVERPDQPSTLMRVVVRYTVDNDFAAYDDPGGALEPWWASEGSVSGELCGINDGFVYPDFPERVGEGPADRGAGQPVRPEHGSPGSWRLSASYGNLRPRSG